MEQRITRRKAVKTITTGAIGAVACTGRGESLPESPQETAKENAMKNPILSIDVLPNSGPMPTSDPFLFCVHHLDDYPRGNEKLGPVASLSGRQIGQDFANIDGWNMYHGDEVPGFPRHPHRGFETVTIVKSGLIDHADSLGSAARYGNGDVQWLTAGDGINHAEMFPLVNQDQNNLTDFFQIWLNLPARLKRVPPHFKMFWSETVPTHALRDDNGKVTSVRVIAGTYFGQKPPAPPPNSWASQADACVGMLTIEMEPMATWMLPAGSAGLNRSVYVIDGHMSLNGLPEHARVRANLQSDVAAKLTAGSKGAKLLLLEGKPIDEPVVQHGPFVMNSREEIMQAFSDYRRTQFGGWPWRSTEPTHGVAYKRFARFADGSVDQPS